MTSKTKTHNIKGLDDMSDNDDNDNAVAKQTEKELEESFELPELFQQISKEDDGLSRFVKMLVNNDKHKFEFMFESFVRDHYLPSYSKTQQNEIKYMSANLAKYPTFPTNVLANILKTPFNPDTDLIPVTYVGSSNDRFHLALLYMTGGHFSIPQNIAKGSKIILDLYNLAKVQSVKPIVKNSETEAKIDEFKNENVQPLKFVHPPLTGSLFHTNTNEPVDNNEQTHMLERVKERARKREETTKQKQKETQEFNLIKSKMWLNLWAAYTFWESYNDVSQRVVTSLLREGGAESASRSDAESAPRSEKTQSRINRDYAKQIMKYTFSNRQALRTACKHLGMQVDKPCTLERQKMIFFALRWFSISDDKKTSFVHLAKCYLTGFGTPQNIEKGFKLLQMSSNIDFSRRFYASILCYGLKCGAIDSADDSDDDADTGNSNDAGAARVTINTGADVQMQMQKALQKNSSAPTLISIPPNHKEYFSFLMKRTTQKSLSMALSLAESYIYGFGTRVDYKKAAECLRPFQHQIELMGLLCVLNVLAKANILKRFEFPQKIADADAAAESFDDTSIRLLSDNNTHRWYRKYDHRELKVNHILAKSEGEIFFYLYRFPEKENKEEFEILQEKIEGFYERSRNAVNKNFFGIETQSKPNLSSSDSGSDNKIGCEKSKENSNDKSSSTIIGKKRLADTFSSSSPKKIKRGSTLQTTKSDDYFLDQLIAELENQIMTNTREVMADAFRNLKRAAELGCKPALRLVEYCGNSSFQIRAKYSDIFANNDLFVQNHRCKHFNEETIVRTQWSLTTDVFNNNTKTSYAHDIYEV